MCDVLIVDDDGGFVQNCALLLRRDGYTVATADSVDTALTCVARDLPRATLLDWKLPDGTALDVLRWRESRRIRIPTAIITGFWLDPCWEAAQAEARRFGVEVFIDRGVNFEEPAAIVARLLDSFWGLHAALLRHDEAARDALARQLPATVIPRLQARFPTSPDRVEDAATEAVYRYLRHPSFFRPGPHKSVERFVYGLAQRVLWNGLRSEERRREREHEFARRLELIAPSAGWATSRGRAVVRQAIAREPDVHAQAAIRAWLDGDRSLDPWLAIQSVRVLPPADQRSDIERRKDAFRSRVKRLARRPHSQD